MVKSALYAAIGFVAISSTALAEDLSSSTARLHPGTFTTSAHSDEWKIANALSAGPASITEHAAVMPQSRWKMPLWIERPGYAMIRAWI
jgi:hypothetical protein